MEELFASIAGGYDRFNTAATFGLDRAWRKAAAVLTRGAARILDVCAGTGEMTVALARLARPKRLVAVDLSPDMLALAANKAKHLAPEAGAQIEFVLADAERLPFSAGEFDAVTVGFGVRNLRDRGRAFGEFHRVLVSGGRCVLLELFRPRGRLFRAGHSLYLSTLVPLLGGMLAGNREAYAYLRRSVLAFPPPEEVAGELQGAGFGGITVRPLTFGAVAVITGTKQGAGQGLPEAE